MVNDSFVCPGGHELRHTTTSKDGKRTYRSATKVCKDCPCRSVCGANENGQRKLLTDQARDLLDSAGCEGTEITWGSEPVDAVEAIMQAAGRR